MPSPPQSWHWGNFRLRWAEVYQGAGQIMAHLEKLLMQPDISERFRNTVPERYGPRMPFYRQKLDELKRLIDLGGSRLGASIWYITRF